MEKEAQKTLRTAFHNIASESFVEIYSQRMAEAESMNLPSQKLALMYFLAIGAHRGLKTHMKLKNSAMDPQSFVGWHHFQVLNPQMN